MIPASDFLWIENAPPRIFNKGLAFGSDFVFLGALPLCAFGTFTPGIFGPMIIVEHSHTGIDQNHRHKTHWPHGTGWGADGRAR